MTYPLLKVLRVLVGEREPLPEAVELARHVVQLMRRLLVLVVEPLLLDRVCVHLVLEALATHLVQLVLLAHGFDGLSQRLELADQLEEVDFLGLGLRLAVHELLVLDQFRSHHLRRLHLRLSATSHAPAYFIRRWTSRSSSLKLK